jgi:hypothetical protein
MLQSAEMTKVQDHLATEGWDWRLSHLMDHTMEASRKLQWSPWSTI